MEAAGAVGLVLLAAVKSAVTLPLIIVGPMSVMSSVVTARLMVRWPAVRSVVGRIQRCVAGTSRGFPLNSGRNSEDSCIVLLLSIQASHCQEVCQKMNMCSLQRQTSCTVVY